MAFMHVTFSQEVRGHDKRERRENAMRAIVAVELDGWTRNTRMNSLVAHNLFEVTTIDIDDISAQNKSIADGEDDSGEIDRQSMTGSPTTSGSAIVS